MTVMMTQIEPQDKKLRAAIKRFWVDNFVIHRQLSLSRSGRGKVAGHCRHCDEAKQQEEELQALKRLAYK